MRHCVGAFALLVGCARSTALSVDAGNSPRAQPASCSVTVEASTEAWKEVVARDVTFCVPVSWTVTATQAVYKGGSVRWQFLPPRAPVVSIPATYPDTNYRSPPLPEARPARWTETIGGRTATLWGDLGAGHTATGASWREPVFTFMGVAAGEDNAQLQLQVYRTVRFATR